MITNAKRIMLALLCVGGGWLAVMLGAMFVPGAAPASLVIMPPSDVLARFPQAVLLDARRMSLTLAGVPTVDLYRAGALLVLPAGLPLCVGPVS